MSGGHGHVDPSNKKIALLSSSDAAKKQIEAWKKTAERYQSEPDTGEGRKQLMERAQQAEKKRGALTAAIAFFAPNALHLF